MPKRMKTMRNAIILLLALLWSSAASSTGCLINTEQKRGSSHRDSLKMADRYLFGDRVGQNYRKAAYLYTKLAKGGDTKAMNRLAGMYRQGFGVEKNPKKAARLYFEAAKKGNGKASYNLAGMFRQGEGVARNYEKAYKLYKLSYRQGYRKNASYALGYMSYKGLGTEQSYEKALKHFHKGDSLGDPSCQYFIGLCHIAGDGAPQDIEKGKRWMEKALKNGSEAASGFIRTGCISKYENHGVRFRSSSEVEVPEVRNTARGGLSGVWNGKMTRYDWGRKRIVEETPLELRLDFRGESLSGYWTQNDSVTMRVSGQLNDSVWVFNDMRYEDTSIQRPWDVTSATFRIDSTSAGERLVGRVEQFSPETQEPSSPVSISLSRTSKGYIPRGIESAGRGQSLTVSPNPFDREVTIAYTLSREQSVRIMVNSMDGTQVYSSSHYANEGENTTTLSLDVPAGTYTVGIEGEGVRLSAKIVRR